MGGLKLEHRHAEDEDCDDAGDDLLAPILRGLGHMYKMSGRGPQGTTSQLHRGLTTAKRGICMLFG